DRVRIVVYLKREPSAPEAVLGRVRAIPGVSGVTYIAKADALRALKQVLGKDASVVDHLPANPLPASLEVTPSATAATPEGARDPLVHITLAIPDLEFFGPFGIPTLRGAGTLLGGLGGWLARARREP